MKEDIEGMVGKYYRAADGQNTDYFKVLGTVYDKKNKVTLFNADAICVVRDTSKMSRPIRNAKAVKNGTISDKWLRQDIKAAEITEAEFIDVCKQAARFITDDIMPSLNVNTN